MTTILTDDERREILWSCTTCNGHGESTDASAAIRKTEAAVLAKLREQGPTAWVWNPASQGWEKVRAPGHWQQGAIYAFGPAAPEAPAQPTREEVEAEQLDEKEMARRRQRLFERMDQLRNSRAGAPARCWCQTCRPITLEDMRMVLCPECGNKRCPKANDHRNACTGSNEPGQPGSAYP